jgi:hypothetical protein
MYIEAPGKTGPFERNNMEFLQTLLARGEPQSALDAIALLERRCGVLPGHTLAEVDALLALDQPELARARLELVRHQYDSVGPLWAMTAILARRMGHIDEATRALAVATKLGVRDERMRDRVERELGLPPGEVERRHMPFAPKGETHEEQCRRWLAAPHARIRLASEPSPHVAGGNRLRMPPCRGCGHDIRLYVLLDARAEPRLVDRVPNLPWFPLLGCPDCTMSLGRHDYEIDVEHQALRLIAAESSPEEYGEAFDEFGVLPETPIELEWIPARAYVEGERLRWPDDAPQILGEPWWIQTPLRPFCRKCRDEMTFVAAMASIDLGKYVAINNDGGFQYHFACNACRTLSVMAQWT